MALEKLEFETNVPVELALRCTTGKAVESRFGGEQKMFSSDKGVFYVAGIVGNLIEEQITQLGIKAGDPIEVCKREVPDGRGRKAIRWQVARKSKVVQMGEQPDGTFAVPAPTKLATDLRDSIQQVEAKKAVNGRAAAEKPAEAPARPRWADVLTYQTNVIVDVYAACLKHASDAHGNAIKPDDVRSLLVTAFIQLAKGGSHQNA